jgi:hypothetical protein
MAACLPPFLNRTAREVDVQACLTDRAVHFIAA